MAVTTNKDFHLQQYFDCPAQQNCEEILQDVQSFVTGVQQSKDIDLKHAQLAIRLLKRLPTARAAALEYLCMVFDEAVNRYVVKLEGKCNSEGADTGLEAVIKEAHDILTEFVVANPSAWTPIISSWSIELLGQLSSKYAMRKGVPDASKLDELLQYWMTCPPTRNLIDTATQCISAMMADNTDVCIAALLDTSAKHTPNFDWVVAHIGSCFPMTMITKVLHCGLKDFCSNTNTSEFGVAGKMPTTASVVRILGHLVSKHGHDIKKALLSMFHDSLADDVSDFRLATVPYLLHLASLSPVLLKVMATDFIETLSPEILNKLARQTKRWHYSPGHDLDSLLSLIVHLTTTNYDGAMNILQFHLDSTVNKSVDHVVQTACILIMDSLVVDLQRMVFARDSLKKEIPFLSSLQQHHLQLCKLLLTLEDGKRITWLCRILAFVGICAGEQMSSDIMCHIICFSSRSSSLNLFLDIIKEVEAQIPGLLGNVMRKVVVVAASEKENTEQVLANILTLLKWTKKRNSRKLAQSLQDHVAPLSSHLLSKNLQAASTAIKCMYLIGVPRSLPLASLMQICARVTAFFFSSLSHLKDCEERLQVAKTCRSYCRILSELPGGQQMLLRYFVQGCLLQENSPALGGRIPPPSVEVSKVEKSGGTLLVEENAKHGMGITLPQSHSSVFHAGVIGKSIQSQSRPSPYPQNEITTNQQLFMDMLYTCSLYHVADESDVIDMDVSGELEMAASASPSADSLQATAKILVELIPPDVLYNGTEWPDESFLRYTLERDLEIRNKFFDNPVLWELLEFVAQDKASLCSCSVLLRSLIATLLSSWESSRSTSTTESPWQLSASCRILEIMHQGKMLPPPLCFIGEIFQEILPYELFLLLGDVWRYMHENSSKTDLHSSLGENCNQKFTETLRSVLHKNIIKLAHHYSRFFNIANPPPADASDCPADIIIPGLDHSEDKHKQQNQEQYVPM